jgi:hypothetical protein
MALALGWAADRAVDDRGVRDDGGVGVSARATVSARTAVSACAAGSAGTPTSSDVTRRTAGRLAPAAEPPSVRASGRGVDRRTPAAVGACATGGAAAGRRDPTEHECAK